MTDLGNFEEYPLIDAIDHEILMHREAHFGGLFSLMLDYYKKEGKGANPDFTIERIEQLAALEKQMNQNLAVVFLAGAEAEKISEVKQAYKKLRDIYEVKNPKNTHPRLIADLILSEEEEPLDEIAAIVAEKGTIVSLLVDLLRNEDFHDPLFPGYGLVPSLAAECLGQIGDKRAVFFLFEELGKGDFFEDERILRALKLVGEPAKEFLLRVVRSHPINEDNEKAAIGLGAFKEDQDVSIACFKLLEDSEILKDPCLPAYLVLACKGLKGTPYQESFVQLVGKDNFPKVLKEDVKTVIAEWKETGDIS